LQFFTKKPNEAIRVVDAPKGVIPNDPWGDPTRRLPYGKQIFGDRWLLLTGKERALIDRLYERCKRLDNPTHTKQIFQGLITSADAIYHLKRIGPGRYLCQPEGKPKPPPYEVEIEEALMKPLVSGAEAKRYVEPHTETFLLFPYQVDEEGAHLINETTMRESYPKAWTYLSSYRDILQLREAKRDKNGNVTEAPFDDASWYRFGRHQNLDKQEIAKLIVPRLVANLGCSVDDGGRVYLDNVDVGGVVVAANEDPFFIAGILNSDTANFVFKRISKPFRGSYLSANKQFIAPLPVPPATLEQRLDVAKRAKALQAAHTARRDALAKIEQRLSWVRSRSKPETWLFPNLTSKRDLIATAPMRLDDEKKREWADRRYELDLAAMHDAITARLRPGAALSAAFVTGELSFSIDGVPVIERVFVADAEGEFIVAQWKVLAATFSITENTDGQKMANALRKLAVVDNPAVVQQVINLEAELSGIEADIFTQEIEMNALVDRLYGLSEADAKIVRLG
jgi:hypothetical protein